MGELRSKGRWSLINEIASYPGAALRRVFLIGYFLHSRGIGWRLSFREMHFLLFAPGLVDSTAIKGETAFPFLRWYPTNFSFIQAIISWIRNYSKYDTIFSTHHVWIIRNKTVWIFIDTSIIFKRAEMSIQSPTLISRLPSRFLRLFIHLAYH